MELGIYTFGDRVADPITGRVPTALERMRQMLDMAKLADDVGLDIIGVGEHHGANAPVNSGSKSPLPVQRRRSRGVRCQAAPAVTQDFHQMDNLDTLQQQISTALGNDNFKRGAAGKTGEALRLAVAQALSDFQIGVDVVSVTLAAPETHAKSPYEASWQSHAGATLEHSYFNV